MSRLKPIMLFFIILTYSIGFAQYTDVINSNRPGESMSAFSVGKSIFQTEIGIYKTKEQHNSLLNEAKGYGTDITARWGLFFEQLELDINLQYQKDKYSSILVNEDRKGFRKALIGAKFLAYDPYKNYEEKINVYSWKANHRFKWRQFIPAVSVMRV